MKLTIQSLNLLILFAGIFFGLPQSLQAENVQSAPAKTEKITSGLETDAAQVVVQFHAALRSKQQSAARQLLDENVIIFEGGKVERSADEYAHHHMLADMNFLSSVTSQTIEHHVEVTGDIALSISRTSVKGQYRGKDIDSNGMETMVLKKIQGDWKITHIHWSN
jgi:ketosteroid isomerase-like protein